MEKRGPLTPDEHRQRVEAARSPRHRHQAETTISVRQGSTGTPSRAAVGLFRQGQQRPDSRGGRGVWDTRTTEPTAGHIRAKVTFHFPTAYESATPDPAIAGSPTRPPLAMTLSDAPTPSNRRLRRGRGKIQSIQRAISITNPEQIAEAM